MEVYFPPWRAVKDAEFNEVSAGLSHIALPGNSVKKDRVDFHEIPADPEEEDEPGFDGEQLAQVVEPSEVCELFV